MTEKDRRTNTRIVPALAIVISALALVVSALTLRLSGRRGIVCDGGIDIRRSASGMIARCLPMPRRIVLHDAMEPDPERPGVLVGTAIETPSD